jgi:acetyltransferase
MTVPRKKSRFDPAHLFHPETVSLSGAHTQLGQRLSAHLTTAKFSGSLDLTGTLQNPDLTLIADAPADIPAALQTAAKNGARGAIVLTPIENLREHAAAAGIRVLGPHSYGIALPFLRLNGTTFPSLPGPGRVALVGQSATLACTVIDWAIPNAVGFSNIIGIGGNAGIGFGLVLDHLSRDPGTSAILVEVDRLRDPKLFHTAARAAARLRPVIALLPGTRLRDESGRLAIEAAFARAGVLLASNFGEFLAAAETLTRVKPARSEQLAILSNSVALGRLAADNAIEHNVPLATLSPETRQVLALRLGKMPAATGPIYAGLDPTRLSELAALLSTAPEVGGILVIHAPSLGDDETAMEAIVACAKTIHIPLLIAAMGDANGAGHRHRLAAAGLACFDTPEAAIAGFRHLLRNRRIRAAARELPSSTVLTIAPDKAAVTAIIAAARANHQTAIVQDQALAVIAAYNVPTIASRHASTPADCAAAASAVGFPAVVKLSHPTMPTNRLPGSVVLNLPDAQAAHDAARAILARLAAENAGLLGAAGFLVQAQAQAGLQLRIRVADNALLGPVISFGRGGGDPDNFLGLASDLPPLNLALAHALIHRAPVAAALAAHRGQPAADEAAVAATLVRVSQLIIDTPEIALLELDPLFATADGVVAASARILLRPPGEARPPLIISPYPSELTASYEAKGRRFTLRPIRPEDADAYAAMFSRFTAQDMRYRFFSALRTLPTEQITRMTDIDYGREMAIIAVEGQTAAGGARLVRNDTDGRTAEFAVGVEPAAKGLGLATALMRAIIEWGKANGVQEIQGQILSDNAPMLAFIQRLGFTLQRNAEEPDIMEARLTP